MLFCVCVLRKTNFHLDQHLIVILLEFVMISLWSVWLSITKKCLIPKRGCITWSSCSRKLSQLGCEFWKDRELESQFEYFEFMDDGSYVPKLAYRSLAGLKIFGGCSRALPKKSLRLVSRARYEKTVIFRFLF